MAPLRAYTPHAMPSLSPLAPIRSVPLSAMANPVLARFVRLSAYMTTLYQPQHPHTEGARTRSTAILLHFACQCRSGFTLMEMLVVIVIIGILASMTGVAVKSAKEKARQTACMSNLRQLGTAIVTYRADNFGRNPKWLSNLYPTYIDDKRVYVCRSDKAKGTGNCRPAGIPRLDANYNESVLNDYDSSSLGKNSDIKANSYLYEFSAASSPWPVAGIDNPTWNDYKENQLAKGDNNHKDDQGNQIPYSSSRMPIVRCYHHAQSGKIRGRGSAGESSASPQPITLNVAYAGNVIISPLWWEGALEPGEE